MLNLLALLLVCTFVLLALVHVYWACGGHFGKHSAVPEVQGRAAFVPGKLMTSGVAAVLLVCGLLVAATAGWLPTPLPLALLCWLLFALALVFFARAMGDFRWVGFFKTVHGTRFARLDSAFYSPLCGMIGVALLIVGLAHYL